MSIDAKKAIMIAVTILSGLLLSIFYYSWFSGKLEKEQAYKNTDAGKMEIQGDIDIRKMKAQLELDKEARRRMQLDQRNAPRTQVMPAASPPVRVPSPQASLNGCKTLDTKPNFFTPVKLSQGDCLAGTMDYVWVHFDAPPIEISGAGKVAVGTDMTDTATGNLRVRMTPVCQGDVLDCVRNWSGQTLFIQRVPGQNLIIKA